jgi:RNA polymerase sigma factor (sigma-70 family)
MAGRSGSVLGHLYQLLASRDANDQTDGQLLGRFVANQEEQAFATLVQRHGPLVLRVCRRLLGNSPDADDAFQATFLVLVRKARTLDQKGSLAGWLFGVAYRVAVRARAQATRRRAHERQAAQMYSRKATPEPTDPALRELLDAELSRLPEKYRSPVVLCYLEGKTYAEAARQLQWPLGTVRGRVARARILLRKRLTRRGLAVPIGLFGTVWASEAASAGVPSVLMNVTVRAALLAAVGKGTAAGAFSAHATALGEAVLKEMIVTKLKTALTVLMALTVISSGAGLLTQQAVREDVPEKVRQGKEVPNPPSVERSPVPRLTAQFRHGGNVRSLAFSLDGKTLASASGDTTLLLWDLTVVPPRERCKLQRPKGVVAVAFSPNGRILASGSVGDDKVYFSEPATGHDLGPHLPGNDSSIRHLAFSPKGAFLAVAGYGPTIHLWDFEKQKKRHSLRLPEKTPAVNCLAFSPGGAKLASAGAWGGNHHVHLWDIATGQEVRTFPGHQNWVNAVAFFPDGQRLISGSADRTIRLWDLTTGQEVRRWQGDPKGVSCLVLSRDGKTLFSGGGDQTIRLWEAATGKELHRLAGHPSAVAVLALSPDGTTLASGGQDGSILLWKLDGVK